MLLETNKDQRTLHSQGSMHKPQPRIQMHNSNKYTHPNRVVQNAQTKLKRQIHRKRSLEATGSHALNTSKLQIETNSLEIG